MSKLKNKVYKKKSISFSNNIFNNKYFINLLTVFYMKHYNKKNPIEAREFIMNLENRKKALQQFIFYNRGHAITDEVIDFDLLNNYSKDNTE